MILLHLMPTRSCDFPSYMLVLITVLSTSSRLRGCHALTTPAPPRVFKHVFRHYDDVSFDSWLRCTEPHDFMRSVGYTAPELQVMAQDDESLWDTNVHSHWAPKIRFLVETLHGGTGILTWASTAANSNEEYHADDDDPCVIRDEEDDDGSSIYHHHMMRLFESTKMAVPAWYYHHKQCPSLDRSVVPKHAYLVHHNIHPHSEELLTWPPQQHSADNVASSSKQSFFTTFLEACQSTHKFVELCNQWDTSYTTPNNNHPHSIQSIQAFESAFGRGLIPAVQNKTTLAIPLLLAHGANHLEYDRHGIVPLFWAAGLGRVTATQALWEAHASAYLNDENDDSQHPHTGSPEPFALAQVLLQEREPHDGATLLHWACCGVHPTQGFGVGGGGSYDVCRLLLERSDERRRAELVNAVTTRSGTTPLHWCVWTTTTSGSSQMAILELLLLHGANPHALDRQGNSAAHYAAASGSLTALQYLIAAADCHVDAQGRNSRGQTPLDCAREFQREHVVAWLLQHGYHASSSNGIAAMDHARDHTKAGVSILSMDPATPTIRSGSPAL